MICLPSGDDPRRGAGTASGCYHLKGRLTLPSGSTGLVLVAWENGSNHGYRVRRRLAQSLSAKGLATCEVDLCDPLEPTARQSPCDLPLMAERLVAAIDYLGCRADTARLPLGLLGGDQAAVAALVAAERRPQLRALVCCAGDVLRAPVDAGELDVPTMLLVPSTHRRLMRSNERFFWSLTCTSQYAVIRGAGRQFREPGTLLACERAVTQWCIRNLEAAPVRRDWREAALASRN